MSAIAECDRQALPERASAPIIVSWNTTRLCNLACGHCYLDAVQRKREAPNELRTEEALGVIDQLAGLSPGAMLVLTGGEPLMRRDLVDLVRAAAQQGLVPVIGTNGTLLTPERARVLKDAGAAGVGISLDSATPAFHDRLRGLNGAWQRAVEGIEAARAAGLTILMQMTLFEDNRRELATMADLAEVLGAMAFNLFFLVCTGRGVTQTDLSALTYEETLREIDHLQIERPSLKIRARCAPYMRRVQGLHAGEQGGGYAEWSSACLAGRQYFRITPKGEVTPCPYISQPVGDLRTQPLREIWTQDRTLSRLRGELPGGKCGACDYRLSCGGCRARAYAACGDIMAEDPKCSYVPRAGVVPESSVAMSASTINWTPEAHERLLRVPAFLRERVRLRLEERARAQGLARIGTGFMAAHRPAFLADPGRDAVADTAVERSG